ncbi:MAG: IS630 family transposase [Chloroflexota bacterium]
MLFTTLTTEDEEQLQVLLRRTEKISQYVRLKVIELSAQGHSVSELAEMFHLNKATIRTYIHAFKAEKFAGLSPQPIPGRPQKLKWTQADWLEVLNLPPSDYSLLNSHAQNWSLALLKRYFEQYHHLDLSRTSIHRYLQKADIRWKRARLRVHSPDPLYQVKRQRVESLRHKAMIGSLRASDATHPPPDQEREASLVYFDIADLRWCPDVCANYSIKGLQVKVDSPGLYNPWYGLLGSLIYPSGEGLYTIHDRKRSVEIVTHLQLLIDLDPDRFWFVVLDNASAHHTDRVQQFQRENQDRIEFVYLPTYSPHLNLIERLWRVMRSQVTKNQFFESLDHMAWAVINWLNLLPFSQFCSIIGIQDCKSSFV